MANLLKSTRELMFSFFDAVLEIASYSKKSYEESVEIFKKLKEDKNIHPQAFRAFLKGI